MPNPTTRCIVRLCLSLVLWPGMLWAQPANPYDEIIDTIRDRTDIGESDQTRMGQWVEAEINRGVAFKELRKRFHDQYRHARNTEQFKQVLTDQTTRAVTTQFAKANLNADLAFSLAYVLVDMDRPETFPGLIAGLKVPHAVVRYICAKGLTARKQSIAANNARFGGAVQALRDAGLKETDPVVLGRIYEALSYPARVAEVFDAYVALFDKRLALRRGPGVVVDGAERHALDGFFRVPGVLGALNPAQKTKLVSQLAVFLRLDGERYNTVNLKFKEIDNIERCLDGVEAILTSLGIVGGNIRNVLRDGGHSNRAAVLKEVYRWVGNKDQNEAGALNREPWNVPIGAP